MHCMTVVHFEQCLGAAHTQISNRGRLVLGQEKEDQIEWHLMHQISQSVGPNRQCCIDSCYAFAGKVL